MSFGRVVRCIIFLLILLSPLSLAQEAKPQLPSDEQLESAIQPLLRNHQGDVGLAIKCLETREQFKHKADVPMPTASLIKLPMLVAAYRMVDSGGLDLDQRIELKAIDKVPGSGVLTEHFSDGVQLPLRDYLRLMIRYSDNTATNVVADRIGLRTTAATMESLGWQNTKLHSKVYRGDTTIYPERSREFGIGSTTAEEMVELLSQFHAGGLASEASTAAMLEHLLACDDKSKLAKRIPSNVKIAHKSGAIANCRTDAGVIYTTSGPVAVCFLSNKNEDQSWSDDNAANTLAAKIGQIIVNRFGSPSESNELRDGSLGQLVEALQRTLNDRLAPSPHLAIDGDFGPATRGAVERFQREQQLDVTGVVSTQTWKALGTLITTDDPLPPPNVVNSEQLLRSPQPDLNGPPIVTCKAWAIADRASGAILYESNSDLPLEAASTTKIMTAYLVIRHAEHNPEVLEERVTFSARADNTVGSTSGLRAGERVTVRDLLYGLLLPSGNDAAVSLAEHFGTRLAGVSTTDPNDSFKLFIQEMNVAAKELGMQGAHYENPHGLSNETHVISAAGLLRLSHAALKSRLFREISQTRQFGCVAASERGYERNVVWKSTNQLLEIEGYSGLKTGTTSAAGACLVSCGERNGDQLLAAVLGSSSSPARYADTRNLLRWVWKKRAVGETE